MSIRHFSAGLAGLALLAAITTPAGAQPRLEVDCEAGRAHHVAARGVAFLVIHRGALVCERYDRGVDPGDSWWLASGTKSFAPVMVALAVQDGLLELDQPTAQILDEWADDPDQSAITIRHLLDQSSGLAVNPRNRRLPGYQRAVDTRQEFEAGERFRYGAVHFEALGEVLRRQLDADGLDPTPADYLLRRFLRPLGIGIAGWRAVDGQPALSEGTRISALDWGRFGQAVLARGQFGEIQLGDEEVWAAMFEPSAANPDYGLGWWLIRPDPDDWPLPFVAVAAGAGGQRLYVIPDLELVIVRMTRGVIDDRATRDQAWSDRDFLRRLIVARDAD
ncbi:beta-lactamase [Maricaulis maris MCS10]|uniref:Beta-lactamase n=1 Tax=Maricaulis maris (strain MCS10) TaxID=394221 RepID=Q0ARL7_MARMM|nr:serine hydrolase [Maricaulis maris]ABI65070.1 beta-lactamase [Maricaulis maris MCS10]